MDNISKIRNERKYVRGQIQLMDQERATSDLEDMYMESSFI